MFNVFIAIVTSVACACTYVALERLERIERP